MEISVVMPVYNSSDYLDEAIQSVLNQTFSDFEFIIVDDGSTDNSIQIIKQYIDRRIVLCPRPHSYIASLNYGIEIAKGKYIVRMDADDKMLPDRLQMQFDYMENHTDIAVCGSWFRTFGCVEKEYYLSEQHEFLICGMLTGNPLCHPSVIIRRSVLEQYFISKGKPVYNPQYLYAEDYKLWCDIVMNGGKLSNIQKILLLYRCSDRQVSSKHKMDVARKALKVRLEYLNYIIRFIMEKEPQHLGIVDRMVTDYEEKRINFEELSLFVRKLYEGLL